MTEKWPYLHFVISTVRGKVRRWKNVTVVVRIHNNEGEGIRPVSAPHESDDHMTHQRLLLHITEERHGITVEMLNKTVADFKRTNRDWLLTQRPAESSGN